MSNKDKSGRLKKQPTGDYPEGYCRPPKGSRWPKGTSGNPGGRTKGTSKRLVADMIREALNKKVTITTEGKDERITILEAAVRRQANDLVSATPAQRQRAFNWLLQLGMLDPSPSTMTHSAEARAAFLAKLAEMARRNGSND